MPAKVVAQLMGHANVDVTMNVYTQVLDGSAREAVERVGAELFTRQDWRATQAVEHIARFAGLEHIRAEQREERSS